MSVLDGAGLQDDKYCFACGPENPAGLKMRVEYEEECAVCRITLARHYQGWAEIAHGGIVCTLLDEIMAYAVLGFIGQGVTANMSTRFRKPVPLQKPVVAKGWVKERKGRKAVAQGEIRSADEGTLLAQAEATWIIQLDKDGTPVPFKF
jgi:acyl-coenzyme A thioesterase PaaI-like protein